VAKVLASLDSQTRERFFSAKHDPLKRLMITYISVIIVILVTITAKEFLVSFALGQERTSRAIAQTVGRQRSRAFTFLTDTIAIQEGTGNRSILLTDIKANDAIWEAVQTAALNPKGSPILDLPWWQPGFPPAVIQEIQSSQADFTAILATIKEIEASPPSHSLLPEIHVLAEHVPTYQATFLAVYNGLSIQADGEVQTIGAIEFFLYILTFLCVLFEALFVITPTLRNVKTLVHGLVQYINEQEASPPVGQTGQGREVDA
jgi:hypothetical protein